METLEAHLQHQVDRSERFFWNRLRWDLVLEHLPIGEPVEVVDVGAGTGFLGDVLQRERPQATYRFVEPIPALQDRLTSRFGAESNAGPLDPFGPGTYVTLLDVLEHQADDRLFMQGLAARMPPLSTLLVTVPALPALWSDWDEALGHHRRYTKGTLRQVISGLPFRVAEMSFLFPELLPLGLIRRIRARGKSGLSDGSAEFPDLPGPINETLYLIGKGSLRLRRWWPAGTSLFAVLERG
jgi:hypothetical protein